MANGNGNGGPLRIIATPSGYQFARQVDHWLRTKYLAERTGHVESIEDTLIPATFVRFGDSDSKVVIDEHISGDNVFIIADTESLVTPVADDPAGQERGYKVRTGPKGMQLLRDGIEIEPRYEKLPLDVNFYTVLSTVEATKNALKGSGRVTVVLPCFPSARQERREGRESLDLRIRFSMLHAVGVDHVVCLDPHSRAATDQAAAGVGVRLEPLRASHTLMGYLKSNKEYDLSNAYFGSPDEGAVKRAKLYAKQFGAPWGIVYKGRDLSEINKVEGVEGQFNQQAVAGRDVYIPDDMIDSGGTMIQAAGHFKEQGAHTVNLIAIHPIFTYPAIPRLREAYQKGIINKVIVTNSITLPEELLTEPWITSVDVARYHAKVIDRLYHNESVSELLEAELDREH